MILVLNVRVSFSIFTVTRLTSWGWCTITTYSTPTTVILPSGDRFNVLLSTTKYYLKFQFTDDWNVLDIKRWLSNKHNTHLSIENIWILIDWLYSGVWTPRPLLDSNFAPISSATPLSSLGGRICACVAALVGRHFVEGPVSPKAGENISPALCLYAPTQRCWEEPPHAPGFQANISRRRNIREWVQLLFFQRTRRGFCRSRRRPLGVTVGLPGQGLAGGVCLPLSLSKMH